MVATLDQSELGWKAHDFTLPGIDGRRHGLADLAGPKGLVVAFICNHCPYVRSIAERIQRDAAALHKKGVGFVAINSNDAEAYPEDSFENMERFARERGLTFPYLHDESQDVAAAYGAVCTPDFFGFDKDLVLRYRGRLDASRTAPVEGARPELLEAMTAVAEGGEAPGEQHPPMGCSIKWKAGRQG